MHLDTERHTAIADIRHGDRKAVFQQGRPVLGADLNANSDMLEYQRETGLRDIIGRSGFPRSRAGFAVRENDIGEITLTQGHAYLDGALIENRKEIVYRIRNSLKEGEMQAVYLTARKSQYNYLVRDEIRDPGLGGVDTAGRAVLRGEITVMSLDNLLDYGGYEGLAALRHDARQGAPIPTPSCGTGTAGLSITIDVEEARPEDHCLIREGALYLGRENAHYVIEIHNPTASGNPTFKFARQRVHARLSRNDAGAFILEGHVDDAVMAFRSGSAVEIKGEAERATGRAGILGIIRENGDGTYDLSPNIVSQLGKLTGVLTITRWDHDPLAHPEGVSIGTGKPVPLEYGLYVRFKGEVVQGDFWECAARVETGDILWPPHDTPDGFVPSFAWRRCAMLALIRNTGDAIELVEDMRNVFPDLTHLDAEDIGYRPHGCATLENAETVHEALNALCASIDREGCTIRVRPDGEAPPTDVSYGNFAHHPTLREVFLRLGPFLEQTRTPKLARDYLDKVKKADIADPGSAVVDTTVSEPYAGLQSDSQFELSVLTSAKAQGASMAYVEKVLSTHSVIAPDAQAKAIWYKVGDEKTATATYFGRVIANDPARIAESIAARPGVTATPAAEQGKHAINPYFLQRRLCLELLPGEHTWPGVLDRSLINLSGFTLKGCFGGGVSLKVGTSITLKNCVDVRFTGLNIFIEDRSSELRIEGGKIVRMTDVTVTRGFKAESAPLSIGAKTRIDLDDLRVNLKNSSLANSPSLALHILDCKAYTTLENVKANGYLILGRGVPGKNDDPIAAILGRIKTHNPDTSAFGPFEQSKASNNSAKITNCRLEGVMPGKTLGDAATAWANNGRSTSTAIPFLTLRVEGCEFDGTHNLFVGKTVILSDTMFSGAGSDLVKGSSLLNATATQRTGLSNSVKNRWSPKTPNLYMDDLLFEINWSLPDALNPKLSMAISRGTYGPRRPWSVSGVILAAQSNVSGNTSQKTPRSDLSSSPRHVYNTLIDLPARNTNLYVDTELSVTLYPMIRNQLLVMSPEFIGENKPQT